MVWSTRPRNWPTSDSSSIMRADDTDTPVLAPAPTVVKSSMRASRSETRAASCWVAARSASRSSTAADLEAGVVPISASPATNDASTCNSASLGSTIPEGAGALARTEAELPDAVPPDTSAATEFAAWTSSAADPVCTSSDRNAASRSPTWLVRASRSAVSRSC